MGSDLVATIGPVDVCVWITAVVMLVMASRESAWWGLFCIAFPLAAGWLLLLVFEYEPVGYKLAALMFPLGYAPFLAMNWHVAWKPFTLFLLALLLKGDLGPV